MFSFDVMPREGLPVGVCGYCGARRRIAARARMAGTAGGRGDGECDVCLLCQQKGPLFLESAFIADPALTRQATADDAERPAAASAPLR